MKIITFKDKENKEYTLQIKKGNEKPISKSTYIFNMSSSFYCPSIKYCPFHRLNSGLCYALRHEIRFKNVLKRALKDTQTIDYLVQNDLYKELANKIINMSKRSKTHKIKNLRINERGDIKTLKHLVFINNLSNILYKELKVTTTIYTHNKDIYKQFKDNYTQSKGLIIIGSDFNANLNFTTDKQTPHKYMCCSNCIVCAKQHKKPLCYDITLKDKGIIIYEELRGNKDKLHNITIKESV